MIFFYGNIVFTLKIKAQTVSQCENIFLNLHRNLEVLGMKVVRTAVLMALAMLIVAACSSTTYCNCG